MNLFKKLFRKDLTIEEIMERADRRVLKEKHGKLKFICLYAVVDKDNGFKTMADGFKRKADAKEYCRTCHFNYFINPYWERI